ncbi:hypothetical protein BJY00DRAFT_316548 [Aspergillus carlsbadensis]|nr:hypothetical protein BJY00DRAFT_316548 [Aspergillus carlsbadensis]
MAPVDRLSPNVSESSPRPAPVSDTVPSIERPVNNGNNKTSPGKKRGRKIGKENSSQKDKPKDKSPVAPKGGKGKAQPRQTYILESSDKFPDIIIEDHKAATEYTKKVQTSDTHWVIYTDASSPQASPEPLPLVRDGSTSISSSESASSASRGSSPSETESLPPPIYSSAAVVYEDHTKPLGWNERGFGLQGVVDSSEAEMCAVDQALQLALDTLRPGHSWKRVSILTDSQVALRALAEQLKGEVRSHSEGVKAAAEPAGPKALKLRDWGIQLELRWVPGHKKIPGNVVADHYAGCTREAFENLKVIGEGKITPYTPGETVGERHRRQSHDSSSTLSSTGDSPSQEPD